MEQRVHVVMRGSAPARIVVDSFPFSFGKRYRALARRRCKGEVSERIQIGGRLGLRGKAQAQTAVILGFRAMGHVEHIGGSRPLAGAGCEAREGGATGSIGSESVRGR